MNETILADLRATIARLQACASNYANGTLSDIGLADAVSALLDPLQRVSDSAELEAYEGRKERAYPKRKKTKQ